MALCAFTRCSVIFRNLASSSIRAPVCKAWYGTLGDNGAPSRPVSPFFLFFKQKLHELKEQHPGNNVGVWSKQAGAMWRDLTDEEKKVYINEYKLNQASYMDQLKTYTEGLTPEQLLEHRNQKKQKNMEKDYTKAISKHPIPKKPKRAMWQYAETLNLGGRDIKEYIAKVREAWRTLPDIEKQAIIEDHDRKKAQWKEEYLQWLQAMLSDGYWYYLTTSEVKQVLEKLGMPKPPVAPFLIYDRACGMERGNMRRSDFLKMLSLRWKQLTDEEKKVYIEEAQTERKNYSENLSQWKAHLTPEEAKYAEVALMMRDGSLNKTVKNVEKKLKQQETTLQKIAEKDEEKRSNMERRKFAKEEAAERRAKNLERMAIAKQKEKEKRAKEKLIEKLAKDKMKF